CDIPKLSPGHVADEGQDERGRTQDRSFARVFSCCGFTLTDWAFGAGGRTGWRALLPFDWRDQSVSAPRQSFDVLRIVGIVCERLAQDRHCHVNASIEFHHGIVRPKHLAYFLAGDDRALPLHQDAQNLKGLLAEQDLCRAGSPLRRSDREKLPGTDVELKCSKADSLGLIGRPIHGPVPSSNSLSGN